MGGVVSLGRGGVRLEGDGQEKVRNLPFVGAGPQKDGLALPGRDFEYLPAVIDAYVVYARQRGDGRLLRVLLPAAGAAQEKDRNKQKVGNILFHNHGWLES